MKTKSDVEWTFLCERCGAAKRTHMLEAVEGDLISFVRLCDRCLRLEHERLSKPAKRTR